MDAPLHDHDLGLAHDLPRLLGRRRVLQLLGVAGAAALVGCGGDDDTASTTTPGTASGSTAGGTATTTGSADTTAAAATSCAAHPRGDGGTVPRRRLQRSQRARRERRRAQRHPVQLRLVDHRRRGRAADDQPHRCSTPQPAAPRSPARPSTCGTATARAATRCTRRASRARTTSAACRSPTPTAWSRSRASSRPPTRAGGRTSTSRSTRASTRPRPVARRTRRRRSPCPRTRATAVYATAGYEQSVQNLAQTSLASDNVFGDDGGVSQLATVTGDVTERVHGRPRRRRRPDRRVDRWRRWRPPTRSVTITTRRMPRQAYGGCRCVVRTASASSAWPPVVPLDGVVLDVVPPGDDDRGPRPDDVGREVGCGGRATRHRHPAQRPRPALRRRRDLPTGA